MLYSEFMSGTKCRDTEHNYSVFKSLEQIYMNDDKLSKETIYKAGKLLVDNSLTEEQERENAKIMAEIEELTEEIETFKKYLYIFKSIESVADADELDYYKGKVKLYAWGIKDNQEIIKNLKEQLHK